MVNELVWPALLLGGSMLSKFIEWVYSLDDMSIKEIREILEKEGIKVDPLIKKIKKEIKKKIEN